MAAKVLCDNVKGLCLTLDPSHYHHGPMANGKYDPLFAYVCHTQLRDTNKKAFQVKVGQGDIEYGRIISQLAKFRYQRALCVNIIDDENPSTVGVWAYADGPWDAYQGTGLKTVAEAIQAAASG